MADRLLIAVLAAGASRRLGRAKQLVLLDGETMLHRQCRVALESGLGSVAVILGCGAPLCADAVRDLPVLIHVNESWQEGLAASIRAATQVAIDACADGLLLLHADQFRVTSNDLKLLHCEWSRALGPAACRAVDENYAGPPVILPASSFSSVSQLRGDEGARRVLDCFTSTMLIEVLMPSARHDLDTADQLVELKRFADDSTSSRCT